MQTDAVIAVVIGVVIIVTEYIKSIQENETWRLWRLRVAVLSGGCTGLFSSNHEAPAVLSSEQPWTREPLPWFMICKTGLLLSFTWSHCCRRLHIDAVKDTDSLTSWAFVKEHSSSSWIRTLGTFVTVIYETCPLLHESSMWTQQTHGPCDDSETRWCHASLHLSDERKGGQQNPVKEQFGAVLNFLTQEHQMTTFTEKVLFYDLPWSST